MFLLTILVFVIILGLLIFVHELGHFVAAKRAGMRVEEFGFGFPPRLLGIKRGETIYSINWIPLGGFVKIMGEDGGHHDNPRAFGSKSFWPRLGVLLAGVGMNFFLGWVLLFLGFTAFGTPAEITPDLDLTHARVSQEQIAIVGVQDETPAQTAGFRAGDVILSVNGQRFSEVADLVAYTKAHAGSAVVFDLKRGKETLSRDVTPRVAYPEGSGPVGFAPAKVATVRYGVFTSLGLATSSFFDKSVLVIRAFGQLFQKLVTSGKLIEGLSGPVGIAVMTRDFTVLGFVYLVQFTAILSINLGVINAFPFPALDGGRVLFLIVEKIRGVKSVKWEQIANLVGFVLLLLLMAAVTFRDYHRYSEQFKQLFERLL